MHFWAALDTFGHFGRLWGVHGRVLARSMSHSTKARATCVFGLPKMYVQLYVPLLDKRDFYTTSFVPQS